MRILSGTALFLLAWGAVVIDPARLGAAEWSVVPDIKARAEYDSNLNFSLRQRVSDYILSLAPSASFSYATESGQLQGVVGVLGQHYLSHGNLDHIDQFVQISGNCQVAPRLKFTLAGAYISDSTLLEELTASGFIIGRTVRQSVQVGPGLVYHLTERLLLNLGYRFYEVHYRTPLFFDYSTQRVSLGLTYLLNNEKSVLRGLVLGRFTSYNQLDNDYQSLGAYLGMEQKFTENWDASLLAGVNVTRVSLSTRVLDAGNFPFFNLLKQVRQTETATSPYVEFSSTRRWARADLTGGYLLDIAPSGSGSLYDYSRAFLSFGYNISERLSGKLNGNLYYNGALFQGTRGRTLVLTVAPELNYKLKEDATLSSGYYYGWRNSYTVDLSTPRNMVWISLSYHYPMYFQR